MKKSPNFLIIQADQMTPIALSMYGNKICLTPNLQKLSDDGVLFNNAYCNYPLCVPSRASMLSGQFANKINVWDNASAFSSEIPTIPHFMRKMNYHTTLCGKMHFIGADQLHGFNERLVTDIYPSTYAWTADWEVGEHYRPTGINLKAVKNAGVCKRNLQIDYDDEVAFFGNQTIYDLVRYKDDNPFMLWVSFTQPHSPYITTQKYWDLYNHADINMPDVSPIPFNKLDQMSKWLYYGHGGGLDSINDDHVRNARHAYYGMCSYIDDKVGELIETLKDCGKYEDTIIVFTSDHGEMLGERGMWFKQYFYEPSVRIPLIFHYPKHIKPAKVDKLVSLIDIAPTMIDYAKSGFESKLLNRLQGVSLRNLLETTEDKKWNNQVISEFTGEGVVAPCRMIRKDDLKLIYIHGHKPLLYDLNKDPLEINDIAENLKHKDELRSMMVELLKDWDPSYINNQCISSQQNRLFIHQVTNGSPEWTFLYRNGDDQRYVRNASAIDVKTKARFPKNG